MKISVVTPTRGDRPQFIQQCKKYVARQTLQPFEHIIVDYPPVSAAKDLKARVESGCNQAVKNGADYIAIMEDDDYYHPTFLNVMMRRIEKEEAIGIDETIYYHLKKKTAVQMGHLGRSSLFCSIFSAKFIESIFWPQLQKVFIDLDLWNTAKDTHFKHLLKADPIAIGVKHGIGICAGAGHSARWLNGNWLEDAEMWFKSITEKTGDYEFYQEIAIAIAEEK